MPRWGEPQPFREYLAARVAVEDRGYETPCWVWQLSLTEKGYARVALRQFGRKPVRVHRASYEEYVGPIPDGLQIDHLCRVRACCNPDHLEPVTGAENTRRGEASPPWVRNAAERLCEHGYSDRAASGRCRTCHRVYMRVYMRERSRRRAIERAA